MSDLELHRQQAILYWIKQIKKELAAKKRKLEKAAPRSGERKGHGGAGGASTTTATR